MANYFIKIEDGPEVRRKILESSKASLHTLKGYQELLRIRSEKISHMNALRMQLKEMTVLLNRAEMLMPQLTENEVAELQPKAASAKPLVKPLTKPAQPEGRWVKKGSRKVFIAAPTRRVTANIPIAAPPLPPLDEERPKAKQLTELEKLEAALSSIEGKLGNL
jgi:hypothetical protein